jgi:hypothetical protein
VGGKASVHGSLPNGIAGDIHLASGRADSDAADAERGDEAYVGSFILPKGCNGRADGSSGIDAQQAKVGKLRGGASGGTDTTASETDADANGLLSDERLSDEDDGEQPEELAACSKGRRPPPMFNPFCTASPQVGPPACAGRPAAPEAAPEQSTGGCADAAARIPEAENNEGDDTVQYLHPADDERFSSSSGSGTGSSLGNSLDRSKIFAGVSGAAGGGGSSPSGVTAGSIGESPSLKPFRNRSILRKSASVSVNREAVKGYLIHRCSPAP